jgi:hypothetical protein
MAPATCGRIDDDPCQVETSCRFRDQLSEGSYLTADNPRVCVLFGEIDAGGERCKVYWKGHAPTSPELTVAGRRQPRDDDS